jgi:acyl-coenzyme A thioesterase PaaI-like protein
VKETPLRAVGRVIKTGKRQDVAEMSLYDKEGNLVGHATGTFVILRKVDLP